jgi:DNA-binding FadR family transcriptional regulator
MLEEHRRIVTALETHDPTKAERAMRAHARASREELRRVHLAERDGKGNPRT